MNHIFNLRINGTGTKPQLVAALRELQNSIEIGMDLSPNEHYNGILIVNLEPSVKPVKSINQLKKEAGEHLLDAEYWNEPY